VFGQEKKIEHHRAQWGCFFFVLFDVMVGYQKNSQQQSSSGFSSMI
jgi:hypothetical protein